MTTFTTDLTRTAHPARRSLSTRFWAYVELLSRSDQMAALNARSDAELARMGLRREDIARHVFRDKMHM